MITFRLCDCLTKVLPGVEPRATRTSLSGLVGETLSFQTAWLDTMPHAQRTEVTVSVTPVFAHDAVTAMTSERTPDDSANVRISAFHVGLVPANIPAPELPDEGYFATDPTLLPDILLPLELCPPAHVRPSCLTGYAATTQSMHRGWNSIWWDVTASRGLIALDVEYAIRERRGRGTDEKVKVLGSERISVIVVDTPIRPPRLHNVQWFHADSLATYYGVDPWSPEHWRVVRSHMDSCARMHINTLLTPVWTPPLDTAPGTYRRNVQLLDIAEHDGSYTFDFTRLDTWLAYMQDAGLTGVEVPHLFTQWGAHACPRFWITDDDSVMRPRFGWETPATAPEYRSFLTQLIPALRKHLAAAVGEKNVWYHVSDEPEREHLESYRAAREVVMDMLEGAQVIDALGEPGFHDLVATPVVATDQIPRFRERGIEPTWVYYCVAQDIGVANRFIAQHPNRHRMLGFQLYAGRAEGYLHWAFNFYNTQYSLLALDPYRDTSAGGAFISGDTFVVYPGADGGVVESLRHRMLRSAFDDLAVCQMAEETVGREAVLRVIDPQSDLDYDAGWVSEEEVLRRRAKLNQLLTQ